jgi:oligo-1,6-glucosidase
VFAMMRWWLDKGIDGFRMDVINLLAKAPGWPDAPVPDAASLTDYIFAGPLYANNESMHELLQEMHRDVLSKYDVMTVGECHFISPGIGLPYVQEDRHELDMLFHFDIMVARHDPEAMKRYMDAWYGAFNGKAWQTISLNNHDTPRQVSSFGDDGEWRTESAKLLAMLLLTAPGTPFLYQGEELGMANVRFPSIDFYRDIETVNLYREKTGRGASPQRALEELWPVSRDNARTPMQWDDTPYAGFTKGSPWIGVNPDYTSVNARRQEHDPGSVLHFYRRLLCFRKQHGALVYGDYHSYCNDHPSVFVYSRSLENSTFLVFLNFSGRTQSYPVPEQFNRRSFELCITNYSAGRIENNRVVLGPWQALLYMKT